MSPDLTGKHVLLTGGTEGIGKAAAAALAALGPTLVLVGRNPEKTERVAAELRERTGNPAVETILADLSLRAGVRAVVDAYHTRHDRLDVLINNAGAIFLDHALTADGIERTFALDHLSYFSLTLGLLDLLRGTPGARVVSTASGAHRGGRLILDTVLTRPDGSAGFAAYGDAKLANILFTRELARRLADTGQVANCFHPGWVSTGFGLNNAGLLGWAIGWSAPLLARTPEQGADTLIWLASAPEAGGSTGEYFKDRRPTSRSALARNDVLAAELWERSLSWSA